MQSMHWTTTHPTLSKTEMCALRTLHVGMHGPTLLDMVVVDRPDLNSQSVNLACLKIVLVNSITLNVIPLLLRYVHYITWKNLFILKRSASRCTSPHHELSYTTTIDPGGLAGS